MCDSSSGGASCGPVAWAHDKDSLRWMIAAIQMSSEVVVHLETADDPDGPFAFPGGRGRLVLAALTVPDENEKYDWEGRGFRPTTWVVPLDHPESPLKGVWRQVLGLMVRTVRDDRRPLAGVDVKRSCRLVAGCTGVDLSEFVSWDAGAAARLESAGADGDGGRGSVSAPPPVAAGFAEVGEAAAARAFGAWVEECRQRRRMFVPGPAGGVRAVAPVGGDEERAARLGGVAERVVMPTVAAVAKVELRGFMLDVEWVEDRVEVERGVRDEAAGRLLERVGAAPLASVEGGVSSASSSGWFRRLMGRAVASGEVCVDEVTAGGVPRWSKGVLSRQAREGSVVAGLVLEHRAAVRRLAFLRSWSAARCGDGAVRASYRVGGAVTGRLSSSGPNMQQVPVGLRGAFVPRRGCVLVGLDYSQLELRVAAFLSRCVPMIEALRRGDDLHCLLAARVAGKDPGEVTVLERRRAKAGNFGLLYGMGVEGFRGFALSSFGVELSVGEARLLRDGFFGVWAGMREWQERVVRGARGCGFVVSPVGRVRWLPGLFSSDGGVVGRAERCALNSPVQGFGSDLTCLAVASFLGVLPGCGPVRGAHVVAVVHDEVVVEVEEGCWERVLGECRRRMEDVGGLLGPLDCGVDVPFVVGARVGSRWGLGDVWCG